MHNLGIQHLGSYFGRFLFAGIYCTLKFWEPMTDNDRRQAEKAIQTAIEVNADAYST